MPKMLKICKGCKKVFETTSNAQTYCSEECRLLYVNQTRKCKECGVEFVPKHWCQTYCSKKCKARHNERARNERERVSLDKVCKYCGKPFRAENGKVRYCSDECRKAVAKENTKYQQEKVYKGAKAIKEQPQKPAEHSIKDVQAVMDKYHCSYGKAVIMMGW